MCLSIVVPPLTDHAKQRKVTNFIACEGNISRIFVSNFSSNHSKATINVYKASISYSNKEGLEHIDFLNKEISRDALFDRDKS